MPFVVTPTVGTDLEELALNGLALNDSVFGLMEFQCPPPRQRQEWIGAADSEWQSLVRNPLHENREITARIAVAPAADMDGALNRIGQVVTALAAASETEDGIPLEWNPAGSTFVATFDVLDGEVVDLPINWENGWLARSPEFTIRMLCKPYWRGEEVLSSTASTLTPIQTMEVVATGDVPNPVRLIVTDTATQSRRHVEWGLEGPTTYNAATSLLLDSDSLVTSGFAGAQSSAALTGVYDPNASGNTRVLADLFTTPVAVCGTGNLTHEGVFRVKARVFSSGAMHRLSWQAGDGPVSTNAWTAGYDPPAAWREIDLGTITIPTGSGKWSGTVEAYAPANSFYQTNIDYLVLIPVGGGYGKARATYSYRPGVISGYDDFTGTTAAANLNARVAPAGGTWATSGSATDFVFADDLSGEQIKRSTTSDASARFAILGTTTYTNTEVSARVQQSAPPGTSSTLDLGCIARWVDSSNYLRATYTKYTSGGIIRQIVVEQIVAGVATTLVTVSLPATSAVGSGQWVTVRLLAFTSGRVIAQLLDSGGTLIDSADTSSSSVATGGALASGKVGLYDRNLSATAITRYYDDVLVATPAAEPVVVYSGRTLEITDTDTIRQDSTGTYTGRPQSYRGSRCLAPVGTSRVLVKARRNDIDTSTDDNVTDATQIQVAVTPRGLVVPRA